MTSDDSNIYTVNVDGSHLTPVTHGGGDSSPDWGTHPLTKSHVHLTQRSRRSGQRGRSLARSPPK
jgi:hypothetical protein